jgi:hypothetical protein
VACPQKRMDIVITKDHMQDGVWVFAGAELRGISPLRAADLMRNGLARPARFVDVRMRQPTGAVAGADMPAQYAAQVKIGAVKGRKKDVQTSAQGVGLPAAEDSATVVDAGVVAVSVEDAGGGVEVAVQTSAQDEPGAGVSGGGDGNVAD